LRRTGGQEYAAPMTSAAPTDTSSTRPWVTASTTGTTAHSATIRRAAGTDSSPAAMGSSGLLMRSISTSSSWLMPTMKTFTHQPASRTQTRSSRSAARSPPARSATAMQ
jgi:hypothetical protein